MPLMVMHAAVLLADTFVAAAWTSVILAGGVALAMRTMPALPARMRSLLWVLTFAMAMVLPVALLIHQAAGAASPATHVRIGIHLALPVAALWIGLSIYRMCGLLTGAVHLSSVTRRAVASTQTEEFETWCNDPQIVRRVQVRISDQVDRPSVVGYVRPTILLPAVLLPGVSEADLRQILLHEMQHVRRFDDCVNLLQKIGVALFPFSLALLWIERQLCIERELACDDAVLQATGAPKSYASCLTQLAESRLRSSAALLAVAAFGQQSELSRRVYRILQWPPRQASRFAYGVASVLLLCGLGAGTAVLGHLGSPIAFGAASDVSPTVATAETNAAPAGLNTVDAGRPVIRESSGVRLVSTSMTLPALRSSKRPKVHLNRSAVKAGFRSGIHLTARTGEHDMRPGSDRVEQVIEYMPVPAQHDRVPVLQQIFFLTPSFLPAMAG